MARQYQQAEHLLAAAAAIDPQSVEAKYYLARALLEEGQYAEAGKYLDAVVRVEPNGWTYHYWLGWALEEGGNIPAARQEYQRALQLNPDSAEARARLTEVATK
jgi:tetratricopeptide (TPR) repeat protein